MKGIIVLTALPPTKGHGYLIEFAQRYLAEHDYGSMLNVIVCSKPNEPIDGFARAKAIREEFGDDKKIWVHHRDGNDPDLPEDHPDFWNYWKQIVLSKVNKINPGDILFASEKYGVEFAKQLGCDFIPCDPDRDVFDVTATAVRAAPLGQFKMILPSFAKTLRRRVTFFGAESTGKTTLSKYVAEYFHSTWCHEWARPYLEMVGEVLNDTKMSNIMTGQFAAQCAAEERDLTPFVIRDTDLLSTLGYYRILGWNEPKDLRDLVIHSKADLYLVMNSEIPFEPDRLRYGGNKRESTDQFWIDLLEEFNFPYKRITESNRFSQRFEAIGVLKKYWIDEAGFGGYTR